MGILEKISEIEKEIARTQKNKGKVWSISLCLYFAIRKKKCSFVISHVYYRVL